MDDLQSTFRCCGAEGFEDWSRAGWWEEAAVRLGRQKESRVRKGTVLITFSETIKSWS